MEPAMPELDPGLFILYVDDAAASAAFYSRLLGSKPVESSPSFAMFALPSGFRLGLWSRDAVRPAAGEGGEFAIGVDTPEDVQAVYEQWRERGLRIIQAPVDMEFGHTFVALDPDGHRLRVYALSER
jgi:catechol 2,3-dioxygenase-like lactoylglutathione lyase family enzyme